MSSELLYGGLVTQMPIANKTAESKLSRRGEKQKDKATDASTEDENDALTVIDGGNNAGENFEVEYVPDQAELDGIMDEEFRKDLNNFNSTKPLATEEDVKKDERDGDETAEKKVNSDEEREDQKEKASGQPNTQTKLHRRMKIAKLKKTCLSPDVGEVSDATAQDPKLLVYLESYRNTVPVPRHWSHNRKFLQGKRGMDKKPYQLPDYIADTGIEEFRQKQCDWMQGKGKRDIIDYEVLHDAFYTHMKKPPLTSHGDLYYEGKEFEVKLKERKPGMLSQELKDALSMENILPAKYEDAQDEEKLHTKQEDFSDIVAENVEKR